MSCSTCHTHAYNTQNVHNTIQSVENNEHLNFYEKYFKFVTTPVKFGNGETEIQGFFIDEKQCKKKWKHFIKLMIKYLKDTYYTEKYMLLYENKIKELKLWLKCTLCNRIFTKMCMLVDENMDFVIFKNINHSNIPSELSYAIKNFECKAKNIRNELSFNSFAYGHITNNFSIYLGTEEYGGFEHTTLLPLIRLETQKAININIILNKYTDRFLHNFRIWYNHINALKCIDSAYDEKGTIAQGYKQYAKNVKWFIQLIQNYTDSIMNKQKVKIYIMKIIVDIANDIELVQNIGEMIGTFSRSGNLIECMNVETPEQFWRIIGKRTDPTKYMVSTAPAKKGNIDDFIREYGKERINEMFSRETRDIYDEKIRPWLYYLKEQNSSYNKSNHLENMDVDDLYSMIKTKTPINCFSAQSANTKFKDNYTFEEFIVLLGTLKGSDKVQWSPSNFYSTTYGFPIQDMSRRYLNCAGSWVLGTNHVVVDGFNCAGCWFDVNAIGSHASTWKNNYPEPEVTGDINSGFHIEPIRGLDEGFVIVLDKGYSIKGYNRTFNSSCLFSEFFNGNFHKFRKIREMYHKKLRITPNAKIPYAGAMITREKNKSGKYFKFGYQRYINGEYKMCQLFKINGQNINVY